MDKMKDSGIKWIGMIPEKWQVVSIKSFLQKRKEILEKWSNENVLSLTLNGVVIRDLENPSGKMPATFDGYQKIYKGNLVLCLFDIDVTPRCVGIVYDDGVTSPSYSQYTIKEGDLRFYYYLLLMMDNDKILLQYSRTLRSTLTDEYFGAVKVAIPKSVIEQQRIAKFLDEKTALIDDIITDTKQTIEELKSYKQSLISEIVTKGLDSSETLVPSGVEWIGDSPKEWNKFTIGQLFEQVRKKNTGMIETNLLSLSYGRIKKRDINSGDGLLPESFEGYNIIETDDIVLRMTDLQNDKKSLRQGISEERGIITSAYITIRATKKVSSRFVYYQLFGFDVNKGYYGMGSGVRQSVNWNDVKKLPLMLPSFELQNQIADFLDRKTAQIDTLITEKENVISEYENYKKSMIYEYVTGKKRVDIDEGDLN